MFKLAIDSKLRGCDVVAIRVEDVAAGGYASDRAIVRQKKTGRPVRFELSEQARQAVDDYLKAANKRPGEFLFVGRRGPNRSMTTRQYARLVSEWIGSVGLDPRLFGTHSLRRTKATLIYRRTGNLRAVQLLLGHTKIESTVRYLGIEVDDALAIAEQVDEIPGQSRLALPDPKPPVCASKRFGARPGSNHQISIAARRRNGVSSSMMTATLTRNQTCQQRPTLFIFHPPRTVPILGRVLFQIVYSGE
jgi:Phage integrase family